MGADVTMDTMRADLPFDDRHRGPEDGGGGPSGESVVDFFAAAGILAEGEEDDEDDQDIDDVDGTETDDGEVTDG